MMMTVLGATPSLSVHTSFLALFLAGLQGLVAVDPSLSPKVPTSPGVDNIYRELRSESDSQVRRTSDGNALNSVPLGSNGRPFPHFPTLSLQLGLEGAQTPTMTGPDPPATPLSPPQRTPTSWRRRRSRRRRRRRRSKALDSSDPLCLHTQRGLCSLTQEEEQPPQPELDPSEHSHAVSKETIASTSDDPLNVVQPPEGAGSPRSVGTDKALTKKRTAMEGEAQV